MSAKFKISPKDSVKLIVKTALEEGVKDHGQIANILGQCEHETNWIYAEEINGAQQAARLGYGGGFYGRGYIQITHDSNYKKFGKLLNQDFINNPNLVSVPETAAKIAVIGMRDGLFTTRKLNDYINNGNNDFYNARRIVNGMVAKQAQSVKEKSEKWLKQVPALINGADPNPNALPTQTGGSSTATPSTSASALGGTQGVSTGISLGVCSEIFPIEFSLKEALHYVGCFSRQIVNPTGASSNLGYPANGMQVNGASHFNLADFNPTVPICEGCLTFPMKDKSIIQSSPFCERRTSRRTGKIYYHSGTDYASTNGLGTTEGMEVIAVADGTVVTPLVSGGYEPGLVDIVHESLGNLLSRSAHIIPSVQPGTKVKQGDVIGKVGPYGDNAAHLHLELRKDKGAGGSFSSEAECKSIALDPALFIRRS